MVASMAGFAVEDMFLKSAAREMPLGQIMLIMGLLGVATFAVLARVKGQPAFPAALFSRGMAVRSGFEVMGRVFYALAIALTPLSTASAILQATPLLVVAAASILFGEKVSLARWAAILAGFCGVLLIVRPGQDGFSALSLLAVAGMIGFAGRDLATRAAPPALSNAQLGVAGFAMLGLSGSLILGTTGGAVVPDGWGLWLLAGTSVFGILGYHALTYAMRTGDVSVVTPFRYTRLVFALILGVAIFHERPDALTLLGSAVIVAAGVFALLQNRKTA